MGKPWGLTLPLIEFDDCRDQIRSKVEKKNDSLFKKCRNPQRVPTLTTGGSDASILFYVRCRKCKGCLEARQSQWAYRANLEYLLKPRTWWLTLTYKGHVSPTYEDVKKFFKILRKKKHEFRYVISEELGEKNERLHWHILLHCNSDLSRRTIESAWHAGFVHARLAKSAGLGRYLAKYLAKQSRIRASKHYGSDTHIFNCLPAHVQEQVERFVTTGKKSDLLTFAGIEATPWGLRYDYAGLPSLLVPEAVEGNGSKPYEGTCPF